MPATQTERRMRVTTPLGADKLLLTDFTALEALSRLFQFNLTLMAENAAQIAFDKVIGQPVLVEIDLPGGKTRQFHGICSRLSEGKRDATFTQYRMEVVPKLWLLSRRVQSRIFQQITVPDILKKVLTGLDVKWDLKGKYHERDYCVQYRESDFAFASRLMEEEGIYYYFSHTNKGHTLIVADTPQGHEDVPIAAKAIFEEIQGGNGQDLRVTDWEKVQELRSGKVTLWDNCFELPQQNLEAQKTIQESVPVGRVTHKLKLADNDKLELYDFPGAYAQRFDGIDPGGGDRAGDLKKIFEENARAARLRMEREAAHSVEIRGASNCTQFTAGHQFTLERHFNADGAYVLTSVSHAARLAAPYRSGDTAELSYDNRFTCIPLALPYRPPAATPKPTVGGTQTATVVGPSGEKIFCDKYGRVKVQFHWDRVGKKDANSSCWVRVSQNWGGANWGGMFIPHVGQEVIVDFEEGDPDSPLIVGRVYNAEAMPPMELPTHKTKSAIRDHGGNEMIMEGDDGKQRITMYSPHAGTKFSMGAPNSPSPGFFFFTNAMWDATIKDNFQEVVEGWKNVKVNGYERQFIQGPLFVTTESNYDMKVHGNYSCRVEGYQEYTTYGHYRTYVMGSNMTTIVGVTLTNQLAACTTNTLGVVANHTAAAQLDVNKGPRVESYPSALRRAKDRMALISAQLQQKFSIGKATFEELIEKVDSLKQKMSSVEATVSGKYKLTGGPIEMESKGDMKVTAPALKVDGNVDISKNLTCDDAFSAGGGALKVKP